MWSIWVDTGGTFTDCIGTSPEGEVKRVKLLSSSRLRGEIKAWLSPTQVKATFQWPVEKDIFKGYQLRLLNTKHTAKIERVHMQTGLIDLDRGLPEGGNTSFEITAGEEVPVFGARLLTATPLTRRLPEMEMRLGSTRGTNALLERKGARTGLIINKGFRDLLLIGNQQRPELFALNIQKPAPLFQRVYEVGGRRDAAGNEIYPPDPAEINQIVQEIKKDGLEAVAVALMHSYLVPAHENIIGEALRKSGLKYISLSAEISPAIKLLERSSTAVVNAYLDPVINDYLDGIHHNIHGRFLVMTSSGGIVHANKFRPKESLLSGPAGGVVGAALAGRQAGFERIITLDMGGTSTDVSLYDNQPDYRYESEVGHAKIQSPALGIETIAAGGGSVITYDGYRIAVGPDSAGAAPGPACYGDGGPLTLTDVNLLLGRIDPQRFSIPVYGEDAEKALDALLLKENHPAGRKALLHSILDIANEKMAEAIRKISVRKGFDPRDFALLSFGGAGGQHACSVARLLDMKKVLIPYEAGLLSAKGIGMAEVEKHNTLQVLKPLAEMAERLSDAVLRLQNEVIRELKGEGSLGDLYIRHTFLYLRFKGQEDTIEIEYNTGQTEELFRQKYIEIYGHWLDNQTIEVESVKVVGAVKNGHHNEATDRHPAYYPKPMGAGSWGDEVPLFSWEHLKPGAVISGPALITSANSTIFCEQGWRFTIDSSNTALLEDTNNEKSLSGKTERPEEVELELFTNRFAAIAEEMGAMLQRSSFSVNIRERLDFSCALLDKDGFLVVNAPHIPVHLGGLGLCVRTVAENLELKEGDVAITNHPGFGGSHLPDITLVAPVFFQGKRVGYVANRAHHAELGGKSPGSMPTDATTLEEEGVIIRPTWLVRDGKACWDEMNDILYHAAFPSRSPGENIADLKGALASVVRGRAKLIALCENYGAEKVGMYMNRLKAYACGLLAGKMQSMAQADFGAEEALDDGTIIRVKVHLAPNEMTIDFKGTSPRHPGNMNATPAIVRSAVLYVLRLLINKEIPLNEGMLDHVKILLPICFLNPPFDKEGTPDPAVVGGNTEVSQRLVDTLIKAFGLAACSQGTMNNLLFGNDRFGYYETICGGAGAGKGFDGADAVHTHMTNTRITDPEILELRYPVKVNRFEIRKNSGGDGKWKGGEGIVRELEFTDDITLTLLTQHRTEAPYGMKGGESGKPGEQDIIDDKGDIRPFPGIGKTELKPGEKILVRTPGGGGYGQ